ncbi:MAG: tryptophan synthase subunit alpha [Candidatus Omnitrophota bacterium]|nr:tryptophan synthase subunit alpha [Candidatus Omnitrophota bacterium]MBU1928868.1 tryptophan synthase subunit alpha [Candidatus Omnitrophota bacterium]MBU2034478.1 tryptophan synthase subunit alpha [Candidatus Omnitrophota bacterium]MBU2221465.1 tryptophan synthase subunit alpha [Candidatus Omnitrophota bacterium]MBU2258625.1 tryptophan synthase subunit alpha [Candidatus Omnitrophota bacterium]
MNRIEKKFKELKKQNKKAFIAFITAGYPDLFTTAGLIREFSKAGVDIIELGVPFSDPLADGAIIQESSQHALRKDINLDKIFNLVKLARKNTDTPICLMSYYNPIFCFGEERFVKKAFCSGVDGVIIPDLPADEGNKLKSVAGKSGLDIIFFLAPTSSPERIKYVAKNANGFIYYVSLTGVTGSRKELPKDFIRQVKLIKRYTDKPVCLGFGVSTPRQIRQINKTADGVIVGSAIVRKIKENIKRPDLIKRVTDFVKTLKG